MFPDPERDRLFIGPFECDPATGQPTGRSFSDGQRIFAIDAATNTYWAAGVERQGRTEYAVVAILDRDTLTAQHVEFLEPTSKVLPAYAFDPQRRLLYVAYLTTAEIHVFAVGLPIR